MHFKEWLESRSSIVFGMWSDNGTIIVYIDGKRYVYNVNPWRHEELQKIAKYRPFEALNIIKKENRPVPKKEEKPPVPKKEEKPVRQLNLPGF